MSKELLSGLYVHEAMDYSLDFSISNELFNKAERTVSLQKIREFPLAIHQKGSAHNKNVPEVHSYSIENPLFTFPIFSVHKKDNSMNREIVRHIREFFREQQ